MKTIIITLSLVFGGSAAFAESLFVPTVHVLDTGGKYETYVLDGYENGVSLTECSMRITAWKEKLSDAISGAKALLKEQGQFAEMEATCEPKQQ